ncbi:MAG: hypothetical protein PHQ59_01205 [Candidatus Daviesbacteria bacterium]|nr:hypothetical protein [Candidatus Daviesbacteria bacterium]
MPVDILAENPILEKQLESATPQRLMTLYKKWFKDNYPGQEIDYKIIKDSLDGTISKFRLNPLAEKHYSGLRYYPEIRIAETDFGATRLTDLRGKLMDKLIAYPEQAIPFSALFRCWEGDYSGAFNLLKVHMFYMREDLRILYEKGGVDLSPYPIPVSVMTVGYKLSSEYDWKTLDRLSR